MRRPTVLALRALKIGDLLVAVPALRGLRRAFPQHRLVLACSARLHPLVRLITVPGIGGIDLHLPTPGLDRPLPGLDDLIDVAVNLHGYGTESRSALEGLHPLRRIGHRAPGWAGPDWVDRIHERERWVRLLRWHGVAADPDDFRLPVPPADPWNGVPAAIVHTGAAHASRHWPTERFARVAVALQERGLTVYLTGSAAERDRCLDTSRRAGLPDNRVLAGDTSLDDLFALVAHCRLLVSADTGIAHLASAFGTPSVVLFGPVGPEIWGPPPGPHRALTDASVRRGDAFARTPDPALLAVGVEDVLREADSLLGTERC